MTYWVFTEEQRNTAIAAFVSRWVRDGIVCNQVMADRVSAVIVAFLDSPEAREHKLQGGASYEGDPSYEPESQA